MVNLRTVQLQYLRKGLRWSIKKEASSCFVRTTGCWRDAYCSSEAWLLDVWTLQSWVNRIVSIRSLLSCLACRWRIFWNYWWFRNPKQPTWNLQNTVNNGINYQPQLVSWTSEPSTVWVHRRENSTDPHKGTKVLLWNTLNEETNGPKNVVFLFKTFWNSCSAQLKCQMMQTLKGNCFSWSWDSS